MLNLPPLAVLAVVGMPCTSLCIVRSARFANCAVTIVASQPVSQINVPTVPPLVKVTLLNAKVVESVVCCVARLLTRGESRVVVPHLAVSPVVAMNKLFESLTCNSMSPPGSPYLVSWRYGQLLQEQSLFASMLAQAMSPTFLPLLGHTLEWSRSLLMRSPVFAPSL